MQTRRLRVIIKYSGQHLLTVYFFDGDIVTVQYFDLCIILVSVTIEYLEDKPQPTLSGVKFAAKSTLAL